MNVRENCIHEQLQLHHASQYEQQTQNPSHPLHKHSTTCFNIPRLINPTIFNNNHYTTNIPTDPHTITTTDIKTNMRHIHRSIVSRHLATRGNNKILRTPPPHISSSEEILPRLTPLPNSEQINHPSSNHTYTKSTPNHIHHHYASSATPTHTPSLQLHPHMHHTVTSGFVDRPRWSDGAAGQMERFAGWWTKSGMIRLPHKQGSREWVDTPNLFILQVNINRIIIKIKELKTNCLFTTHMLI